VPDAGLRGTSCDHNGNDFVNTIAKNKAAIQHGNFSFGEGRHCAVQINQRIIHDVSASEKKELILTQIMLPDYANIAYKDACGLFVWCCICLKSALLKT
jgi:hypothetical protein